MYYMILMYYSMTERGCQNVMTINLRNFPDDLHRKVKIQAAIEGITLKDLIIKAVTEYLKRAKKK